MLGIWDPNIGTSGGPSTWLVLATAHRPRCPARQGGAGDAQEVEIRSMRPAPKEPQGTARYPKDSQRVEMT